MKRNKTQPSNRERVIETAAQLFLTGGYAYTSMDDVMRESHVSKSNIYYHFKSKEDLLLAVVEYWADRYEDLVCTSLGEHELRVEERILAFTEMLAAGFTARGNHGGCPFITLYLQCSGESAAVKARIARFFTDMHPLLAKLFEQGIRKREFREEIRAEEAASLFIAALEGSLVLAETTRDAGVVRRTALQFCRMLHS